MLHLGLHPILPNTTRGQLHRQTRSKSRQPHGGRQRPRRTGAPTRRTPVSLPTSTHSETLGAQHKTTFHFEAPISALLDLPVPHAMLLMKYKSLELQIAPSIKGREVIKRARHPFHMPARLFGRAVSLLREKATSLPGVLEFVGIQGSKAWVDSMDQKLPDCAWCELDVKEMFPEICRPDVLPTIRKIFFYVVKQWTCPHTDLVFHVHKGACASLIF